MTFKHNQNINIKNRATMRRSLFTVLLTLFVSISVFAQRPDREKIKALKIAHITEQLDLTETEAQKFWPVYNANEEAKNKLRKASSNRRKEKDADDLTEAEAKALLLDMEKFEKQKVELDSKLLNQLFKILSSKKIIKLYQAEHSFKQKMFDEYKKRHSNKKSDKK